MNQTRGVNAPTAASAGLGRSLSDRTSWADKPPLAGHAKLKSRMTAFRADRGFHRFNERVPDPFLVVDHGSLAETTAVRNNCLGW